MAFESENDGRQYKVCELYNQFKAGGMTWDSYVDEYRKIYKDNQDNTGSVVTQINK